jgi:hypothetical protein
MSTEKEDCLSRSGADLAKNTLWLPTGFFFLGGSVGFVSGLSDAAVTLPLIAGLLALVGGGFIQFFSKIDRREHATVGKLLCSFTIAFTFLICLGVFVKVNNIMIIEGRSSTYKGLTPSTQAAFAGPSTANQSQRQSLLKSENLDFQKKIESLCRSGDFEALHSALEEQR